MESGWWVGRTVLVAVIVITLGRLTTHVPDASSTTPDARIHPSVRNDLSAPVSSLAPVRNKKPPVPETDGDAVRTETDGGEVEDGAEAVRVPSTTSTRAPATDPIRQSAEGTGQDIAAGVSFRGLDNVDGYIPPDPNGDVGPHDYVQAVNDSFEVFDKQGHVELRPKPVSALWQGFGGKCENEGQGDPVVLYDPLADRFLISQFAFTYDTGSPTGPFFECVAVTRTGDPTGRWYRYAFRISDTKMDDYPKLGVWPDGYYMTVNQYMPNGNWGGVAVVAFDRAAMLQGRPASLVYLDSPDPNSNGMLPADLDGWRSPPDGSPEYLAGFDTTKWGSALDLYRFHVDWSDPSSSRFAGPIQFPVAAFNPNMCGYNGDCIPQPSTSVGLSALSYRLMYRLAYRNFGDHESLVVNHTVDVTGNDLAGIRWYEIRDPGGNPFVYQQGTYAPDGKDRFNGSVAMDQNGDIGLGYTTSSAFSYPSVRYTGRLVTDPLGQLTQTEGTIAAGGGSQLSDSHRWGDYSTMSVDPSDDCTFWYTNEYYKDSASQDWATRIGSFRFPGCGPTGPTLSIDDVSAPEGQDATFTVRLSPATDQTVSVHYATEPGTAGNDDYQKSSGTLTFAPGETTQQVSVPVVADADTTEWDETFSVLLSNATNALIRQVRGTATIPGIVRPDGMIRRPSTTFRGLNVFNVTGWRQTESARIRKGHTRRFLIRIRNTAGVTARYRVRGPGSTFGFAVAYRSRAEHRLVTRAVVAGRYVVSVPPRGVRILKLLVTARRRAQRGTDRAFLVMATSTTGTAHRDAVRARVRVRR
jgi:hypothetical protein